jgi:hypothetical protein
MTDIIIEHKKARRRRARVELIKTLVIIALFVSMAILASTEIAQTQLLSTDKSFDVDIASLLILHGSRTQATIAGYITPEFMGYNISGISRGLFGGESSMREFYGTLDEYLAALLGSGCECRTLSATEGDDIWRKSLEGDYVYVRYFTQLPASAVFYAVSNQEGVLADGNIPYVRELLITLKRSGDTVGYELVARSETGEVSVWQAKNGTELPDFDISVFSAYNDSRQLADFTFLGETDTAQDNSSENGEETQNSGEIALNNFDNISSLYKLPDTTVLTEGEFTQKYITINFSKDISKLIYNSNNENLLLNLFGFNSDRVDPYESKGNKIYLGETGKLIISDSGELEYTEVSVSDDKSVGGISVSSFLGYENYGGNYSYYELLTAAASIIDSLKQISPLLLGADAYPQLVSISGGDSGLNLVFDYFYDNYRIVGLKQAVTINFSSGKLVSLKLTPADITAGALCVSIPQSWSVSKLYADILNTITNGGTDSNNRSAAELSPVYNAENINKTAAADDTQSVAAETETTAETNTSNNDTETDTTNQEKQTVAVMAPVWALLTVYDTDKNGL